jgi:hypothetical protein
MTGSSTPWVVDRNGNLVNFGYVISMYIAHDSLNGSLWTVWVQAFDPTGSYASANVAELTTNTDGTGMSTEADAVALLQEVAGLIGVWSPGPAVGRGY